MDFKLVSKNNIGVVSTLILVILLSQSRFFNFLIDTALGRTILILFILGISYTNKILGVVAVLFIIIMFNQSDISYIEGFTLNTNSNDTTNSTNNQQQTDKLQLKKQEATVKQQNLNQNSQQTTTTPSSVISASRENFAGREGFNIIDREGTMLRGKRSNEVPVFSSARTQTDDIEPTDKSVFTNAYSTI